MAEIDQADDYNEVRGYTAWADLTIPQKIAALQNAADYLDANYNLIAPENRSEWEQSRYLQAKFTLARTIGNKPPEVAAKPTIKSEKKELAGMKKEVEYNDQPGDPFPQVTAWLLPLTISTASPGVRFGRMVRR